MSDVSVNTFNTSIRYAAHTQIHARYRRNHRMCNLTDFFSSKVEQSSVLVDDAYRQIRNAAIRAIDK